MSYLQKEVGMLQRLKDTNYAAFKGDKDKAMRFMETKLASFPEYMDVVVRQQTLLPIWKMKYDGQEFRERAQDLDTERRRCHDGAISSLSALNRLSEKLDLPPFSRVDTNDRYAVADMIGEYVAETYRTGVTKADARPVMDVKVHMAELEDMTGPEIG